MLNKVVLPVLRDAAGLQVEVHTTNSKHHATRIVKGLKLDQVRCTGPEEATVATTYAHPMVAMQQHLFTALQFQADVLGKSDAVQHTWQHTMVHVQNFVVKVAAALPCLLPAVLVTACYDARLCPAGTLVPDKISKPSVLPVFEHHCRWT